MGLRDVVRTAGAWLAVKQTPVAAFEADTPARPVDRVIYEMLHGDQIGGRVGQDAALSVPGVLRARNLIAGAASTLPLIQKLPDNTVERSALLEQIDPNVPNVVTKAQLYQDLLFEGISWWRILARDKDRYPVSASHIDVSKVTLQPPPGESPDPLPSREDPRGAVVWVDGVKTPGRDLIRFDSPNPGVLKTCGRSIRLAILYQRAASMYADNPRPQDFFTPTEGVDPIDDDEVQDLLDEWAMLRKRNATGYVPAALKYNAVDQPSPADLQLVELQKAAGLDVANALGLDPEDLGISTTSRTYQNDTARRQDRINDLYSAYFAAVTERLSMPDVTRRTRRVVVDLDAYMRADPATRATVNATLIDKKVIAPSEVRHEEGRPPMTAAQKAEIAAAAPEQPAAAGGRDADVIPIRSKVALGADDLDAWHADNAVQPLEFAAEQRVFRGTAMPYGPNAIARKNGRRYRFQQGSIVFPADLSRVKLLEQHVQSAARGHLFEVQDTPEGLRVALKVGRGAEGDRVIALALDKVLDGLSVGVDFDDATDTVPDPLNVGVRLVNVGGATALEISQVPLPAFDDARIATVAASRDTGGTVLCTACNQVHAPGVTACATTPPVAPVAPAPAPVTFSMDQLQALMAGGQAFGFGPAAAPLVPETAAVVDPTHTGSVTVVENDIPYAFDRGGNLTKGTHDFSSDIVSGLRDGDGEAYKRALTFAQENFAAITTGNVAGVNPSKQRPDMYVDQRDYKTPLWDSVNKGTLADVTPFVLPKFNASSGLVGDHTEGVEPTEGSFTVTTQTITPTAISGKAIMNREAWDQGGNPQASGLIWRQMLREWKEELESAVATFLNTLTAATDMALGVAVVDVALSDAWDAALAGLQFVRGGGDRFDMMATEQVLYKAFADASATDGRKIYPMLGPSNTNGTATRRYRSIDAAGVELVPAWALASTPGSLNNSWLYDTDVVHGWASAPQRIDMTSIAVATVQIGIWGYKALANTDITGVRQVTYDSVS